jgi:hypothetical protein
MSDLDKIEEKIVEEYKAVPNKTRFIPYIIIAILFVMTLFLGNSYKNEKAAKEKLISDANLGRVIDGIEQPGLDEVKKREADAEALRKQEAEIDKQLALINKNKKLNKSNLEAKKNEIKKANIGVLSRMLAQRGYSSTVIRR